MQFEKADDSRKLAICFHTCQPPQEKTLRIMMYFAVPRNGPNGVSFGKLQLSGDDGS